MSPKPQQKRAKAADDVWSADGNLYPSLGGTRSHCDICGGRVTTKEQYCRRHGRPDGNYVALRDKYVPLRFIRRIFD